MTLGASALLLAAASAQSGYRTIVTSGDCSPVIIAQTARVEINCRKGLSPDERDKLERLPSVTAWEAHSKRVDQLRTRVAATDRRLSAAEKSQEKLVQELRSEIASTRNEYQRLLSEQAALLQNLARELASQKAIIGGTETKSPNLEKQIQQEVGDASSAIFSSFQSALQSHEDRLAKIETRLDALEKDLASFMKMFLRGEITDKVGFFGLGLGAAYIDQKWYPTATLEYEQFLPNLGIVDMKGSLFYELNYINWIKETTIQTLPGAPAQTREEDNRLGLAGIGSRLFFGPAFQFTNTYLGGAVGYSVLGEKTFYYNLRLGGEYFRPSVRLAIEARWDRFNNIKETEVTFNPFGNAFERERYGSASSLSIGLRLSFR